MDASALIKELSHLTKNNIAIAEEFKSLTVNTLTQRPDEASWSILECIEHLNRYGDFYIPEIAYRLRESNHKFSSIFRSGWLGNYFAKSMLPKEKLNKMKTFKSMNPIHCDLDAKVLDKFIAHQKQLLVLLEQSKATDLTRVKTSVSIAKWLKLRLGDTLRVVIYHNLRHMVQAQNTLKLIASVVPPSQ